MAIEPRLADRRAVSRRNDVPASTVRRVVRALAYCRECGEQPVLQAIARQFGLTSKTVSRIAREAKP